MEEVDLGILPWRINGANCLNVMVGYQYTHRPASLDAIANSLRAVAELFNE